MKLHAFTALLAATCVGGVANAFTEDFDDGAAATRWSAPIIDAENSALDGTVDFAFDYSTLGIPSAPGSAGTTTGLFMEVNVTDDGSIDEGVSVGTTSNIATIPAGDFKFSADVWFEVAALAGTTEYGFFGVYASGANNPGDPSVNDDSPFEFGLSNGDGLTFAMTGDGGASADIIYWQDPGNADAGGDTSTNVGSFDDIPFGSIPGVVTGAGDPADPLFINGFGPETGGWVDVSIESVGGLISFSLNGFELASFDNTGGVFSGGTIFLGYHDPFNSSQDTGPGGLGHFIVFDNVSLVPEPTTAVLGALAALGLAVTRRR